MVNNSPVTGCSGLSGALGISLFTPINLSCLVQLNTNDTLNVQFTGVITLGADILQANNTTLNISLIST